MTLHDFTPAHMTLHVMVLHGFSFTFALTLCCPLPRYALTPLPLYPEHPYTLLLLHHYSLHCSLRNIHYPLHVYM